MLASCQLRRICVPKDFNLPFWTTCDKRNYKGGGERKKNDHRLQPKASSPIGYLFLDHYITYTRDSRAWSQTWKCQWWSTHRSRHVTYRQLDRWAKGSFERSQDWLDSMYAVSKTKKIFMLVGLIFEVKKSQINTNFVPLLKLRFFSWLLYIIVGTGIHVIVFKLDHML